MCKDDAWKCCGRKMWLCTSTPQAEQLTGKKTSSSFTTARLTDSSLTVCLLNLSCYLRLNHPWESKLTLGRGFRSPSLTHGTNPCKKTRFYLKKKILIHNQKEGHNLQLSSILEALWSNYFKKILAAAHLERNELLLSIFKSNQIKFTSHYKHTYIKLTSKI